MSMRHITILEECKQEIRSAVIEGNTHYYIRLEEGLVYLDFSAAQTPEAVLLNVGDKITCTYVRQGAEFPNEGIISATGFRYAEG